MDASIPDSFHLAANRLINELEGLRSPEVVIRCLLRACDRIAARSALPPDEVVRRAEMMARDLLTAGAAQRKMAS